jgi:hypothetical protein
VPEPASVQRLEKAGLVGGLTPREKELVSTMSEDEFATLKAIKDRLDNAIGVDTVHGPEDGGLFW